MTTDYETFSAIISRADLEQLTGRMVAAFRAGISGYRRLPDALVEGEIVAVIWHNVEVFRSTTLAGREPTELELEPFRESARARASEGMPLEDLLHAYRLGGRMSWQALVAIAEPKERDGLLAGADILMRYVDVVSATVAQAYLDARQHVVSEEERRLRALLQAICGDDGPLTPDTSSLASRVGIPVAARYRPFALAIPNEGAIRHGQMAAELRKHGILALTEGDRVSGLLADAQELHPHPDTLVAVGAPAPRGALTLTLERVRMTVDLGRRLGRAGPLTAEDIALEMLLAESPDAADALTERVLLPLRSTRGRRASLEVTLRAFIAAQMDRRATAAELHIHPNTLDHRLRRFEEMTALRLTDPRGLAVVVLALSHAEDAG